MRQIAQANAAIGFGHSDAVQAQFAHLGPQIAREYVGGVDLGGAWRDFGGRKGAHRIAQHVDGLTLREIQLAQHREGFLCRFQPF